MCAKGLLFASCTGTAQGFSNLYEAVDCILPEPSATSAAATCPMSPVSSMSPTLGATGTGHAGGDAGVLSGFGECCKEVPALRTRAALDGWREAELCNEAWERFVF